jgi:2-methylcitrate dehydratase PrpD
MMREIANPTMLHDGSGMGALTGLMAVLLAEDGFTGAPAITVEDAAHHWTDLGHRWTVTENYIKPYPICRWAHAALDATGGLMDAHGLKGTDIARIDIRTFAEAARLFPGLPTTTSQAQYSLRFALAARIAKGHVGPDEITGAGLTDPDVAAMMDRIAIAEDPRHSARFPGGRWSDVTLTLTDGRTLSLRRRPRARRSRSALAASRDRGEVPPHGTDLSLPPAAPRSGPCATDCSADTRFSDLLTLLTDPTDA